MSWPGIVHGVVKKISMHTNKKMSVVVVSHVRNPNEVVGVQTADGKRYIVQPRHPFTSTSSGILTIDLLTRGRDGAEPFVATIAMVKDGKVTQPPLMGLPVVKSYFRDGITFVVVKGRHHGTDRCANNYCQLLGCPNTGRPATVGRDCKCYCGPIEVAPHGWYAGFDTDAPSLGAPSLGDPPFIINPRGTNSPVYPGVPSDPQIANTKYVNPCKIVQDPSQLLGSYPTLGDCWRAWGPNSGSLIPEAPPSPYTMASARGAMVGSTNDVVNPFALDAIY